MNEMNLTKKFANIPSPFDNLPEDHPVVFISYSWDSEAHKAWVRKLSDDLREKHSIYTLLDQNNRGGYDLISFMNQAVEKADRVLMIGTPEYKRKSELYDGGGVKYEDQLITIGIYNKMGTSKFIPVLRSGKFDTSFRSLIETRTGYVMTEDADYEETLNRLAADIWNNPINAAPALGPIPNYVRRAGAIITVPKVEVVDLTTEQFVKEIKRLLSTPNSEITFTEMIEDEVRKTHGKIMSQAHYNFRITAQVFKEYVDLHLEAVEKLLAASIIIVRFGTKKQQELLVDSLVKLCMRSYKNGEVFGDETSALHTLAATFLFHAIGLSCVKYGYFQILPTMMTRKVPAGNALSSSYPYSLAHLAGSTHWTPEDLNTFMDSSWLYPYSELVSGKLKPFFDGCFLNNDEYREYFAIWEHLYSLMYVYYKCGIIQGRDIFPGGKFMSESIVRSAEIGGDAYTEFFKRGQIAKNSWEPLTQGVFDGDYSKYEEVIRKEAKFYRRK